MKLGMPQFNLTAPLLCHYSDAEVLWQF